MYVWLKGYVFLFSSQNSLTLISFTLKEFFWYGEINVNKKGLGLKIICLGILDFNDLL